MTARGATMEQAAVVAGLSYERFRKVWRTLVRKQGFPAPFRLRPYEWDPARLDTWRDRRAAEIAHDLLTDPAANDDAAVPPAAPPASLQRGRVAAGRARIMERLQQLR